MQLTHNFNLSEFQSKDGAGFPPEIVENLKKLSANLQVIRDRIGVPININSGYRSPAHNKAIGGSKNSYHMKGAASDLSCSLTPQELFAHIEKLMINGLICKGGLSQYDTFVHFDIRGWFATW